MYTLIRFKILRNLYNILNLYVFTRNNRKTHFVSLPLVQSTLELKMDTITKEPSIFYLKRLSVKVCIKLCVSVPADYLFYLSKQ